MTKKFIVNYWKSLLNMYESDESSHKQKIIGSLIRNIIVFPLEKVIYIKYPKCGGTTILRGIIDKENKVNYHYKKNKDEFISWLNQLTHINDYFIFTITRHPYSRLFSAFKYLYKDTRNYNDFVNTNLDTYEGDIKHNHHYQPYYHICNNKNIFDYIGKIEEDFDIHVRFLLNKLNIVYKKPIPKLNQTKEQDCVLHQFKKINNFYSKDFKLFDYEMVS